MLSSSIDDQGGFEFTIPDGSWIVADINGSIVDQTFAGVISNSIPWETTSGAATLTADLRLRSELSANFEVLGVGADAKVGVYPNLLELVAELQSTDTCVLEVSEFWDINAGAYTEHTTTIHVYRTVSAKTQTTTVAFSQEVAKKMVTSIAAVTTIYPLSADNATTSATTVTSAPLQVTTGAPARSVATLVGAISGLVCLMMLWEV
ncbi:hypothetical protein AK830_g5521 [Neonectria ditissima]|uniref:Uncharacterized protein n=1 Tax=Neonectria ditissima TaxID=78410 RepID=A0A0P7AT47_9HYPO|nr:hypothetical protein AK830_g5521 [Neonectria ditissima]